MGLAAGVRLGPYEVVAALGAGGMGEVYRARDTRLGRDVAIKVIRGEVARDPDRVHRFELEARAAGALNHPNVRAIFDLGTHEGSPFVVMELLEGESLRARIDAGRVPVRKAVDWTAQAARGLAAAHDKGIVHRDLKPENLFVVADGRVKVLDFGLAKLTRHEVLAPSGEPTATITGTDTGAILGTVGYMAPEQARGLPADARSDLFALGAILYELLTGRRAFHGDSHVDTLGAILHGDPPPLSASGRSVPPGIEAIVRHCLEKAPDERFQSARDLAFALEISCAASDGTAVGAGAAGALSAAAGRGPDPASVTYTQLTVQRGRIVSARFSPDGSTVFYAAEWDGMPLEVFETRPGFPTSRGLGLAGAGLLSVSKGGTMEVVLDASWSRLTGTLAEVPLAGGAPRRITEDVSAAERLPDGRTLAVARRVAGRVRIEAPPGRVLHEGPGEVFTLRVSLDGARLAVVERPSPGDTRGSIVVMDTTGRVVTRTAEWNTIRGAAWSADGSEVWYCASNDLAFTDLRAVATDGSERVVARFPGMTCLCDVAESGRALLVRRCCSDGIRGRAPSGEDERELGWFDWPAAADVSADGASLLFDEQGVYGGPQYAVCLRGMDGSLPVRLGEGHALALSPDGAWALALRWGPPQALVLLPTGAGDEVSLPAGTIEQYYDARWMPDGRGIVFAAAERGRPPRTFVQDVAGGPPRPVTPEGLAGAVMSADGAFVLAASADRTLHACPMSGGEPRAVAALLPGETAVQVTPDARFAYTARLGPVAEVFHIELASGARTPWKAFGLSDTAGVSVWTMTLTRDGLGYAYTYCRTLDALYAVDGLR